MSLNRLQRQALEHWLRSKVITQCPACGEARWRFAEAGYVRALLDTGDTNLTEDKGVVKLPCGNCGYLLLFDAKTIGIRGLWDTMRGV